MDRTVHVADLFFIAVRSRMNQNQDPLKLRQRVILVACLVMLTFVVEATWHHIFGG
jgi:hypothetical protein